MEQQNHIQNLYSKYLNGIITPEEKTELFQFFKTASAEEIETIMGQFLQHGEVPDDLSHLNEHTEVLFQKIQDRISPPTKVRKLNKTILWLAAAASAALVLTMVVRHYNYKDLTNPISITTQVGENIAPGRNRATLQLANGKTILLDDVALGQLAQESGVKITKTADGQLSYEVLDNTQSSAEWNTINTPKGGQYKVILPDGSTVYLNAASTLRYPTRFSGTQRRVELSGEAYFEVAKNAKQPFIVSTATQEVQVLGTHFNVNSYTDEGQTVTTLAEGSVKVSSKGKQSLIIKPGEQTVQIANSLEVQTADLETALAWKNGKLKFRDADLQTIMRQIARWYDIEVIYSGEIPDRQFVASVPRTANLSTLLKVLQLSNINFKMEGKKLIVTP